MPGTHRAQPHSVSTSPLSAVSRRKVLHGGGVHGEHVHTMRRYDVHMTPALRPQQLEAAAWIRGHDRAMLAGQMRTGKTAVVLTALEPRHLPALVVSTRAIAERVWVEEARTWRPDLDVAAARGSAEARSAVLGDAEHDVVSLSVASLDAHERAGDLARYRTLIIDESTLVKSPSSSRHLAARRVAARCSTVWALTGTPVPASTVDLWAQWRVIDGGERLGRSVTRHREHWQTLGRTLPTGAVVGREDLPGAMEGVCALVADATLVMLADEAGRGVPSEVRTQVHRVTMTAEWSRAYRRLLRDQVHVTDDGRVVTGSGAGVTALRARQLLAGAVPDESGEMVPTDRSRLEAAVALVRERVLVSPVLVAYGLIWERDEARALLEAAGLRCMEVRERGAVDAWRCGDLDVMLLHPASAGHGLTLHQGGCEMVWLSLPWSLEQWQQACARLVRWSDDPALPPRPVVVHVVEARLHGDRPSVDARVLRVLRERGDVQDAAMREHLR